MISPPKVDLNPVVMVLVFTRDICSHQNYDRITGSAYPEQSNHFYN